jgi:uncharacterized protein (TIGR00269 family)
MLTEEKKLEQRMERLFRKALRDYRLIDDGDRVLVGLSGGKDSLTLLELLAKRSRIFMPRFQVEAAFVRMKNIPYQNDEAYLQEFAAKLDIPLHIAETSFDESTDTRHTHCFLCSWQRRKELFEIAKRLNCNKIALGHNKDDIMQTVLMNLTYQGQFGGMRPKMQMDKFPMTIIRPLCLIREEDVRRYAEHNNFRQQLKNCPYEDLSRRNDMKGIIARLEEMNPEFEFTFFRALERANGITSSE